MRRPTFRLKAPNGTDEANSGNERFLVKDGFVDVPSEMVAGLAGAGGFAYVGPTPEPTPVIAAPSADFVAEVDAALAMIEVPGSDLEHPSGELVAEIVEALHEIATAAPTPDTPPAIPALVIPSTNTRAA